MVVEELKDHRSEEAIMAALERVCSLLPRPDRPSCDGFINQYGSELVDIIIEEGDPSLACARLGVC